MTTTYDPTHPKYSDEADVRDELTRVYDICNGCRLCLERCDVFPTLFEMIDRGGATRVGGDRVGGDDAGRLTPLLQDVVVDECVQCYECVGACPYAPGRHPWNVDVPRLMLRAKAMQYESGITSMPTRWALRVSARTDLLGRIATSRSPLIALLRGRARSLLRSGLRTAHVGGSDPSGAARDSANEETSEASRERFSTWFARRRSSSPSQLAAPSSSPSTSAAPGSTVTVFAGCVVEYETPGVGKELVEAYERAGIECSVSKAGCCGAPWLHAGDIDRFAKVATRNVDVLAAEIRGTDRVVDGVVDSAGGVVVVEPTCRRVIVHAYPDHVSGANALLVASRTFDATDYLAAAQRGVARPSSSGDASDAPD